MSELEPGPALDALIAERIFGLQACPGWEPWNLGSAGGPCLRKTCAHPSDTCYPSMEIGHVFGPIGGPPRYSQDIAAAWAVVERFPEMVLEHLCDGWYCWLGTAVADPSQASTVACATTPLAICLAALQTIPKEAS